MNKQKIYTIILAVLLMVGVIVSQVSAFGGECVRNCPSPMMVVPTLPPGK